MKKQKAETDLAGLVNKMHEQLVALERKVDTLIARSSERARRGDRFQKSGPHFKRPDRYGSARHDERPRENNFTKAVCAKCGKECELPFRPTGDRPVYCKDCFSARNEAAGPFKGKFGQGPRDKKRGSFFPRRKKHFP